MDFFSDFISKINLGAILNFAGLAALVAAAALASFLIVKMEQIKELNSRLNRLLRSFNDLDEQAKLIVKTDLAQKKAQEELDKRLNSLNALHKTSSLISTTLDANEIFRRLGKSLISELGFEKILVLMFDDNRNLHCPVESGFPKETIERIISQLTKEHAFNTILREGRVLSSLGAPKQKKEKIAYLFGMEHFIISPILTQDGVVGILFVGNRSDISAITEGDEELISILSNQIGQSLENAQLFEQVYRSRQDLESKIQDRTKELASTLEEIKIISKAKSDFVSAVSHELRTPLTSIKGYASILMTGKVGDIPQQVKERLEKINKHSDNLVKLINDLLDISRIESGRVEMKLIKHNIAGTVDNIRDLFTPQMKEKNIQFVTEIDKNVPELLIDSSQIERVFINLVGNATKFTPKNGTISVKIHPEKDYVVCDVTDTGIGIAADELPKLFGEFYRVDNEINQNVKGTGLGLALAKNIVEAHHGKIWVTSKVNQGTIFHFTLPIPQKNNAT